MYTFIVVFFFLNFLFTSQFIYVVIDNDDHQRDNIIRHVLISALYVGQ